MTQHALLALAAIAIGVVAGAALFVPFVAVSYRRRGRLSPARLLVWLGALVYIWAIWTYTLLPLPAPNALTCVGTNLSPLEFLRDIDRAITAPGHALTNPALLQLVLNVLLFVPLGFFLRLLANRGLLTAALVGLGVSVLVETTQLTGVWGIYECAYRVFDVDDLLTNTVGAVVGSALALVVPRRYRGSSSSPDADQPRPVTRRRRCLALACDALGYVLVTLVVAVTIQLVRLHFAAGASPSDAHMADTVAAFTTAAVWAASVLISGQTPGDFAVRLRYAGARLRPALARALRALGGVSGYSLLTLLPSPWNNTAHAMAAASLILVITTRRGRGLPGVLSGQQLTDARTATGDTRVNGPSA